MKLRISCAMEIETSPTHIVPWPFETTRLARIDNSNRFHIVYRQLAWPFQSTLALHMSEIQCTKYTSTNQIAVLAMEQ
jgi:hypothetical protein